MDGDRVEEEQKDHEVCNMQRQCVYEAAIPSGGYLAVTETTTLEKQSAIWQEFTRSLGKGPHASDSLRST
jgi:hypothetical protein